jgi:anti-sigma-K factor RskA
MMKRLVSVAAALAVVMVVAAAAVAADKAPAAPSTVTGTITKVGDNTITVTDKDGKDHALTVSKTATVTCDGKDCKLADLDPKKVASVTVTLNADQKDTADKIEAKTTK